MVGFLDRGGAVRTVVRRRWTGQRREIDTYRYAESIPLRDADDALLVNWCELTTTTSTVTCSITTPCDFPGTQDRNVAGGRRGGRCRWKIENENNNTLKTKGYHFEHNYGHGHTIYRRC